VNPSDPWAQCVRIVQPPIREIQTSLRDLTRYVSCLYSQHAGQPVPESPAAQQATQAGQYRSQVIDTLRAA
jgi:hypothetical protein